MNWEVYENSGGCLFLVVMDAKLNPLRIIENWECAMDPGTLREAVDEMRADPEFYEMLDSDCVDRLNEDIDTYHEDRPPWTVEDLYDRISSQDDLVAWCRSGEEHLDVEAMGLASKKAFGIKDEEED